MTRKDRLLLQLLPATLAAALAAAPVLAQSPGSAGGASGNTAATGADTRSSTAQGTTGSGTTTPGTSTSGTSTSGTSTSATTGTASGAGAATANLPADSVIMHRPRLSQLIGTNVYNDRNETIGEVDDIILGNAPGMATGGTSGTTGYITGSSSSPVGSVNPAGGTTRSATPSATAPSGTTTGSTTTGATTPGATAGSTGSTSTTPGTGTMPQMPAAGMPGPVAIIQVGGFLGIGGRLVAVPLNELHWNAERERIIMPNATKETLQGRPAFSYDTLRRG